ncbi:TSC22 domain family protein 4 [Microcaecilia unicolor]|uniref:TSC22 domain family protein 4-like n=1 Tax=Microcaecilia unicolor TaxID=1415580 RepID=A0A6P7WTH0_9AMPH|nr:TSC22 domain family protein 4-like [Microcaecilia unicolor]XP_030043708.1 TSC22 domain family protein 4-like [Microcaecilia unicolor]
MSGGKKKSGFQITSVTSDYNQGGSEGRKETLSSDGGITNLPHLTNGGQTYPSKSPHSSPPLSSSAHPLVSREDGEVYATDEAKSGSMMGPSPISSSSSSEIPKILPPASTHLQAMQAPSRGPSPSSIVADMLNSQQALASGNTSATDIKPSGPGGAVPQNGPMPPTPNSPMGHQGPMASCSSRFRVVKLDQGSGEPYKRGRWTCVDFYDRDVDSHNISKILDSMRHAHSLDSQLEVSSLCLKPVTQFSLQGQGKGHGPTFVHSQGTSHLVLQNASLNVSNHHHRQQHARSLSGIPLISLERGQGDASLRSPVNAISPSAEAPYPILPHSPSLGPQWNNVAKGSLLSSLGQEVRGLSVCDSRTLGMAGTKEQQQLRSHLVCGSTSHGSQRLQTLPIVVVDEPGSTHLKSKSMIQLTEREADERQKAVSRKSRSRSSSPAPPLFRDSSPSRILSDPFSAHSSHLSLARSMLAIGGHHDNDDDSGLSSSISAIDNKIEQAMDLVKSHLMFAVREEVEVLRDQIKDLMDRNLLLEQENSLLRSLASPEQLSELQTRLHSARLSLGPPVNASSA